MWKVYNNDDANDNDNDEQRRNWSEKLIEPLAQVSLKLQQKRTQIKEAGTEAKRTKIIIYLDLQF